MIATELRPDLSSLVPVIHDMLEVSAKKIHLLQEKWEPSRGTPVFTVQGKYTTRGWTEWTQGFQFGSAILQYDATGDKEFLDLGRSGTMEHMASHVSHFGVHDHGFNNVSTYGNLLRLMREKRIPPQSWEEEFYIIALKVSGAVQASRWTDLGGNGGYIYSFNGPHSLFADTVRSLRSLAVAHQLGHVLMGERDRKVSLLTRLVQHADTTARYNVFFGEGRDVYDVRGRVAHESIFNTNDGSFRCTSSQQGYSPFSTWTRGLAWILCGYAEQLEFLSALPADAFADAGGKEKVLSRFLRTADAVGDYYMESSPTDGVPYWDTGAPGLSRMEGHSDRPSDPFNEFEPVDSSAAAIAAQGLVRLGNFHLTRGDQERGNRFLSGGLTVARTIFSEPYLSLDPGHQGLILHSVYHRPNGWDHIPEGRSIPSGEATMWGDYHARELGLLLLRMAEKKSYYTFFFSEAGS
jgi:hypothetical protein